MTKIISKEKKPNKEMPFYRGQTGGFDKSKEHGHGKRQKERNR